jgi:predicted O-methyltransferase YrrM
MDELFKLVNWSDDGKLFLQPYGKEHYRLLSIISQILEPGSKILEIGTRWGASAAALAFNKSIHVITCDLENQMGEHEKPENVEYVIADGYDMLDNCHEYPFIFIDVDPHDGVQETKMIQKLLDMKYKGYVLLDDIHLNQNMQTFWDSLSSKIRKVDLTGIGHYSGSGLLIFSC